MTFMFRSFLVLSLTAVWGTANAAAIDSSDIVTVDGRYWTQPDLFIGLAWDDINSVCSGGVCGTGRLNGHDMAGWVWAGVEPLNQLFNHYIGPDTMGPGPDLYSVDGTTQPAEDGFFDEGGWRETDFLTGFPLLYPAGMAFARMADSDDTLAYVNYFYIGNPFGTNFYIGNVFRTNLPNEDSYIHDPVTDEPFNIGAWFYRDTSPPIPEPAPVPLPPAAWLLAALGIAWWGGRAVSRCPQH